MALPAAGSERASLASIAALQNAPSGAQLLSRWQATSPCSTIDGQECCDRARARAKLLVRRVPSAHQAIVKSNLKLIPTPKPIDKNGSGPIPASLLITLTSWGRSGIFFGNRLHLIEHRLPSCKLPSRVASCRTSCLAAVELRAAALAAMDLRAVELCAS